MSIPTHAADVLIIGGGAGGMACAITLASAQKKNWFADRRIIIVDDGSIFADSHRNQRAASGRLREDTGFQHRNIILQMHNDDDS